MNPTEILLMAVNGLLGLLLTAVGWWLASLHNRHERLRADHDNLRVEIAGKYLLKDEMRESIADLKEDMHGWINGLRDEVRSLKRDMA